MTKERRIWCSLHAGGRCELGARAVRLYAEAKAGQACIVLQDACVEGRPEHIVVCTGGEQGVDEGWVADVVRYPWRPPR